MEIDGAIRVRRCSSDACQVYVEIARESRRHRRRSRERRSSIGDGRGRNLAREEFSRAHTIDVLP